MLKSITGSANGSGGPISGFPTVGLARRIYKISSVGASCASGTIGPPGAARISKPSQSAVKSAVSPGREPSLKTSIASPEPISNLAVARAFSTRFPDGDPFANVAIVASGRPVPLAPSMAASDRRSGAKNTISPACNPSRSSTETRSPLDRATARDPPPGTGCLSVPLGRIGRPGSITPLRSQGTSKTCLIPIRLTPELLYADLPKFELSDQPPDR